MSAKSVSVDQFKDRSGRLGGLLGPGWFSGLPARRATLPLAGDVDIRLCCHVALVPHEGLEGICRHPVRVHGRKARRGPRKLVK